MQKKTLIFLSVLLWWCGIIPCTGNNQIDYPAKKIFILYSYHQTYERSIDFEMGVNSFLLNTQYEPYIEYLDAKRDLINYEREQKYVNLLNDFYQKIQFDIILIADDPALYFVYDNFEQLTFIQNKPIIAEGINSNDLARKAREKGIYVYEEEEFLKETVDWALNLYPKTDHIYVLADYTITSEGIKEVTSEKMERTSTWQKIEFSYNENLTLADLLHEIAELPENTIILTSNYQVDADGSYYSINDIVRSIEEVSNLPIFCLSDKWVVGHVIGGCVNSTYNLGRTLGASAVKYLQTGEFNQKSLHKKEWLVNMAAFRERGIPIRKIPKEAIKLNEETSFVEKYLFLIMGIIGIVFMLIIILFYFIMKMLRKKVTISTQKITKEIDRFTYFVSEMPIAYIEIDDQNKVTEWNKAATKIFGYVEEEIVGKELTEHLKLKLDKPNSLPTFNQNSTHFRFGEARTKKGRLIDCEWYLTNYVDDTDHARHFLMAIDITEEVTLRRKLELMLEKAKEVMLQNDRYMASNIHDIKNLLFPVIMYSEMMIKDDLSYEKMKELSEKLYKAATGLLDVSSNILDVSKINRRIFNVQKESFNIYRKIQDITIVMEGYLLQKSIILRNNVDKEQMVYADAELINSVFINLIGNAVKFSPLNSEIIISSRQISDNVVEIAIKDNGVGIDKDLVKDLFADIQYLPTKGTNGEEGTGLGLVLSKELIEKNGGVIRVEDNQDSSGTTFFFTLPVHPD